MNPPSVAGAPRLRLAPWIVVVGIAGLLTAAIWRVHSIDGEGLGVVDPPQGIGSAEAVDIDGATYSSRRSLGRVLVVNVWATWCAPCRQEIPDLLTLKNEHQRFVDVVGISIDDDQETVRRYREAMGITFPIVMATPALMSVFPAVEGVPTTFVLDRQGRLVRAYAGRVHLSFLRSDVEALSR